MKTTLPLFCALSAMALYLNHTSAAAVATDEPSIQLSVDLRDGSRVVGKNLDDTLSFHSAALGDSKISWSAIRSLEFTDSNNTARLTTTTGDTFTVQLTPDSLHVESGFGKTELPVKMISSVKASLIAQLVAPDAPSMAEQPSSQLTIELQDGSHIVGKGLDETLNFHSSALGDMKLGWDGIRSLEFQKAGNNTATLTATNGDTYVVQFATAAVRVETSFGKKELPVNLIQSIAVTTAEKHEFPPGLVAFWSGDGNTNDSVGGNNGKPVGNVAYEKGKFGQAFVLNGKNTSIDVGNPASLQSQNFTISAWIKRSDISSASHNDDNGVIFGYGTGGYCLFLKGNGQLRMGKTNVSGSTTPDVTITDLNWHHVAVAKSGSVVVFYVDGVAYPAPAFDQEFVFSRDAAIGVIGGNAGCNYLGLIEEVGIYNRALSAEEVLSIFTQQGDGAPSPSLEIPKIIPEK